MAENKFTRTLDAIKQGLSGLYSQMDAIDKRAINIANNVSKIPQNLRASTPNGLTESLEKQNKLLDEMNQLMREQVENASKVNDQKRRMKQLTSDEAVNQKKLKQSADLHAQSMSKLVGAYDRLVAKYKISRQNLREQITLHGKNSKEVRNATREFRRYQAQLNQANRATSNFSKNSLGRMVRGFRNLIGAFGIVGGVALIADLTKNIFNLTKKLQSIDFALRTITKSTETYTKSIRFLDDLTRKYGVELISTTERYTKFLAAAEQSNLSLKDTEEIFETVTKASSVLGLKTDELTGVYLALEQMLSKGKVTTEELRRQLGERLPGAFGIMASALDVTIPKLDDMLKKGEIMSKDALPKFAEELEKVYGIENVNRVDTLVAAQGRLLASYQRMIRTITQGGEGGFIVEIFNLIAKQIDRINLGFELTKKGFDRISLAANNFYSAIKPLLEALGITDSTMKELVKKFGQLVTIFTTPGIQAFGIFINEVAIKLAGISQATKVFVERLEDLTLLDFSNPISFFNAMKGLFKDLGDEYDKGISNFYKEEKIKKAAAAEKERQRVLKQVAETFVIINKLQGKSISIEEAIEKFKNDPIEVLKKFRESLRKTLNEMGEFNDENGKMKAVEGSIGFIKKLISNLKEKRDKLATTREEVKLYNDQIRELEETLKRLQDGDQELTLKIQGAVTGDNLNNDPTSEQIERAQEINDALLKIQSDRLKAQALAERMHFEQMQGLVNGVFETFADFYDLDLKNFEFLYDNKTNTIMDWTTLAKDAIGSTLDASLNRYDVELQEAQRSRDLIVNNELSTEKEKRLANEKFEEEERRIKTKRAKQERTNTLIKIAVDTAAGIAATLAPPPLGYGPLLGPATIPIIAGIGAAQAALVAAQPLPRFAEGTKAPLTEDTLALVGDGGRKEAITENGKLVGVTPNSTTLMMLKKGQEVQKDANTWINDAVYRMNMESNGEILSSVLMDSIMHDEMKKMRAESKRTWEEVKKLAERPINIKNKVIVEGDYQKYS